MNRPRTPRTLRDLLNSIVAFGDKGASVNELINAGFSFVALRAGLPLLVSKGLVDGPPGWNGEGFPPVRYRGRVQEKKAGKGETWTAERLAGLLREAGSRGFTWREISKRFSVSPNDMVFHAALTEMYVKLRETGSVRSEYEPLKDSFAIQQLRYFYVEPPASVCGETT